MDLLTLLKELKKIQPDKDFTLKSRNLILKGNRPAIGLWQILRSNIEFGASIALMVVLFYVMLGGLSSSRVGGPIQISNLDPAGLKAEAQAIDVQIQLTNLNSLKLSESTPSLASKETKSAGKENAVKPSINSASSSSDAVSIDEALNKLSE